MTHNKQSAAASRLIAKAIRFNSAKGSVLESLPHWETLSGGKVKLLQFTVRSLAEHAYPQTTVTATIGQRGGVKIVNETFHAY